MRRDELEDKIIELQSADGLWYGQLSSSAVSTAVACFALQMNNADEDYNIIKSANHWLCKNINEDGGWGDTADSPSNITATLLAYANLSYSKTEHPAVLCTLERSRHWLENSIGTINSSNIRTAIIKKYKTDLTFSVPILTMCTIAGILEESTWKDIPQLPFEFALFPQGFYKFLRLPVVSYAIPALIAVGLAQHKAKRKRRSPISWFRNVITPKVLKKLAAIQPSHGGFLDAPPLTGFVCSCLIYAGYKDSQITKVSLDFLRKVFREDGSCGIDTNLAVWITAKTVKSLEGTDFLLNRENKLLIQKALLDAQFTIRHPFTGAIPGGWGWTNTPGAVPDADDTSAVLIAFHILMDGNINHNIEQGINWLLELQNKDGGMPTFCRGWGRLPFDKSCPDITAHAIEALSMWKAKSVFNRQIDKAITKMVFYLVKNQEADGSWQPLWFGDQNTKNNNAKVYGTSVVLAAGREYVPAVAINRAVEYLVWAQNADGSWGGDKGASGNIEYTAKALTALKQFDSVNQSIITNGAVALESLWHSQKSSPIGLYFASLWYDEVMYPLVFSLEAEKNR
jgi:squalene-hopene/tetraprenyl-beta-curcumene cyclase